MSSRTLRRICLIGGGRWSRVLVRVARSVLPSDVRIDWVTEHGHESALSCVEDHQLANTIVCDELASYSRLDAALVAQRPEQQYRTVSKLLSNSIPTLCEKPLALSLADSKKLVAKARQMKTPLGVNLEFFFATYLDAFTNLVAKHRPREITVTWHDPWLVERYGEIKRSAYYTDIAYDMLPHCWSVLRRVVPNTPVSVVETATYNSLETKIGIRLADIRITISLSRRADQRVRTVVVKDDDLEATIDFSDEPGHIVWQGVRQENEWSGDRPLASSLKAFFDTVESKALDWPLAAHRCDACFELSTTASNLICREQDRLLQLQNINLRDSNQVALVIDRYAPKVVNRIALDTPEQRRVAAQKWLKNYSER